MTTDTASVLNQPSSVGAGVLPGFLPKLEIYGTISARRRILLGILGVISFLTLWSLASWLEFVSPRLLPPPWKVVAALYELLQKGFVYDILTSVYRILFSFALAVAFAYPMGLLIGTSASVSGFFAPLVSAFRYLPAPAFVPLLLMWLGAGDGQKIALLFLGVVWFLITIIADHVRAVPRDFVDTSRTLGADTRQIYFTVIAPASWPRVWDALRQMLAVSWTYLVIAEIVAATDGIGAMMMRAQRFVRVDDVMAGILTIGILGVFFDFLFRFVGKRLFVHETIEQERG
ncbi:ABC transporter permease [Methyloligella solikamskensis]|uniref:ABC transporter permease n=1 Tax=Methyloligella solikamskensis TaxID=1177756 RepID=A0ABW3J6H7_9HYPH